MHFARVAERGSPTLVLTTLHTPVRRSSLATQTHRRWRTATNFLRPLLCSRFLFLEGKVDSLVCLHRNLVLSRLPASRLCKVSRFGVVRQTFGWETQVRVYLVKPSRGLIMDMFVLLHNHVTTCQSPGGRLPMCQHCIRTCARVVTIPGLAFDFFGHIAGARLSRPRASVHLQSELGTCKLTCFTSSMDFVVCEPHNRFL